jgi:hypothetical protein
MSSMFWKSAALAALVAAVSVGPAQAAGRVGWLWASDPGATSAYTPNASYSYSSTGGAITVTPLGTGYYQVTFAKLHANTGTDNVQVTAYDNAGYCMIDGWSNTFSAVNAYVSCFNASGNPENSFFDLLYQERTGIFGTGTKGIAFVYADSPTTASYTPELAHQYNSTGGTNSIARSAAGNYTVYIPGLASIHSSVQVTAVGATNTSAARCKTDGWGTEAGTGSYVTVLCFDATGAAADETFTLAYAVEEPFGLVTATTTPGAWAWANNGTAKKAYPTEANYQYNGFITGRLTSQRSGIGSYTVQIPGTPSYSTSDVLVTAYGSDSSYCNSSGWYPINVSCYAQGGTPINEQFNAAYQTSNK